MKSRSLLAATFGSLAVAAVLLMWPAAASAEVTLTYDDTLKDIQQTFNNPCVIGSPSCNNVLPYTTVPGGPGSQDLNSPQYTVGQLTSTVGSSVMNLLIDVNQSCGAGCPISLSLVEVFVNGVLQFVFNGPQDVPTSGSFSGNGFSDGGLVSLDFSSFASNATVDFHIVWGNQTDGQESFFLAAGNATPVPEPSTLLLLGSGLAGVGFWARRNLMGRFMGTNA